MLFAVKSKHYKKTIIGQGGIIMAKKVRYNGGKMTYLKCSNPKVLTVGKEYEVSQTIVQRFQTNYVLKGVEGYFNSTWFDEVATEIYLAITDEIPRIGERCRLTKIEYKDKRIQISRWNTSEVKEVKKLGDKTYRITTWNSVYYVQVE